LILEARELSYSPALRTLEDGVSFFIAGDVDEGKLLPILITFPGFLIEEVGLF
jgi:hypothetical protein